MCLCLNTIFSSFTPTFVSIQKVIMSTAVKKNKCRYLNPSLLLSVIVDLVFTFVLLYLYLFTYTPTINVELKEHLQLWKTKNRHIYKREQRLNRS